MTLWCVDMLKVFLRMDFLRFTLEYMSMFSWKTHLHYRLHSHKIIRQWYCTFQAFVCLLQQSHPHLLSVSSPHAKALHLTVLPDAADVVHLLKDSLSSATHTENMTN